MANSVAFGASEPITNLHLAVPRMGFNAVRAATLTYLTGHMASDADGVPPGFWEHAVHIAVTGSTLAVGIPRINPADAFSAGLLHDIGYALLYGLSPVVKAAFKREATDMNEVDRIAWERETLGLDHAAAGALALTELKLPTPLLDAVANHHEPKAGTLAAVIFCSELVIDWRAAYANVDPTPANTAALQPLTELCGVPGEYWPALINAVGVSVAASDDLIASLG